jgi:hypothetical protein
MKMYSWPDEGRNAAMASYRFLLLNQGRVVRVADHNFANDLDALDRARELSAVFEVEIWQGVRRAARVKLHDELPS